MFSPFNSDSDFDALEKSLSDMETEDPKPIKTEFPKTTFVCSMKKAFYGKKRAENIEKAVGKIAAQTVIPYPPGVPILIPGEMITEKTAEFLIKNKTEKVMIYEI